MNNLILRSIRYSPEYLDEEVTRGFGQILQSLTAMLCLIYNWEITLVSRHGIRFHFKSLDEDRFHEAYGEEPGCLNVSETDQGDVIIEGTNDAFRIPEMAERIGDDGRIGNFAPLSDAAQVSNGRPTLAIAADLLNIDRTELLPRIANRTNSDRRHDVLLNDVVIRADVDPLSSSVDFLTLATWAFLERASQTSCVDSVGPIG